MMRLIGTAADRAILELSNVPSRASRPAHALCGHLGVDPARAERVHGDLPLDELQRERTRQTDHAVLRRAVRRVARHPEAAEDRGQVDDAAAVRASAAESRARRDTCREIRVDDPPPARDIGAFDRFAAANAGVVDQHVNMRHAAGTSRIAVATMLRPMTSIGSAVARPPTRWNPRPSIRDGYGAPGHDDERAGLANAGNRATDAAAAAVTTRTRISLRRRSLCPDSASTLEVRQRLHRIHAIEEQNPIQMIGLVLHDARGKILELELERLPSRSSAVTRCGASAAPCRGMSGMLRQPSHPSRSDRRRHDLGVDEARFRLRSGLGIEHRDEDAQAFVHLRGREADAGILVHRLDQSSMNCCTGRA